jgi:hypothetical protein
MCAARTPTEHMQQMVAPPPPPGPFMGARTPTSDMAAGGWLC